MNGDYDIKNPNLIKYDKLILNGEYQFRAPPKANFKLSFGEESSTYFQFYIEKPPNAFHRWMVKKFFGIKLEVI